ncbi:hypothetical protein PULV_a0290 [Pseudoalteromonas ulvae UL12]|nr:outer membrane beta-barrel protein [Pseudoalteromonas ulvae]MBE0362739.1 hypothetical protein [Pseudoalteromonas ulvae UL12]
MFKKVTAVLCLFVAATTQANELSDQNLVTRSLTLKDSEVKLSGNLSYAKNDRDNEVMIGLDAGYGITDNWSINIGHTRYRFLSRGNNGLGLELTLGGGMKGVYETTDNQDVLGYGADLLGKYVFTDETAVLFGTQYVFWNQPSHTANADEWRFSAGVQQQLFEHVVLSAGYTYRDLNDMSQADAHEASLSLNYAMTKQLDLAVFATYSNFDPVKNGFTADSSNKQGIGAHVSYRF